MFKILDEVCTPKRGTKYSAYVDLFAREDVVIGAGETKIVKLGVKLDINNFLKKNEIGYIYTDDGYKEVYSLEAKDFLISHYLEVALRSSLGVKGLIIANGIGIIDLDYPDEIGLIVCNPVKLEDTKQFIDLENCSGLGKIRNSSFIIRKADKVAQCTLKEHKGYLMGYESDVVRDGGFGSTGC